MSKPRSLALPPRTRVRRLDTVRGPFAVLDAEPDGERRGTVLLLPGYTGSKEDFLALLGPLTDAGYRAVAVDGRGQHDSPGPRGRAAYRRRALALDAVAQAAALGDGPVHLVGHSFGGLVARAAAAVAPDAFRSLTLLSSGVGRVSRPQRVRVRALRAGLALLSKDRVWRAMCWLDSRGEEPDTSDVPGLADFLLRRWNRTRIAQLRGAGRLLLDREDGTEELLALRTPLHFAYGTDEMVWSTADLAAAAARTGAHHTVVAGAGHSPNVSHPEELTARLLGFWERVAASREVSTAP
ncbi:alpha/beta fold hydrolase [Streptomyces sp. NPDC090109]|uniref:alpha/beta fold hydrolase n=1 Tax=unclassified Streptomyces TaxID=2593676 RepID=UPI000EF78207|nr:MULTISPECIES: alpha/beta hydrolase [unclassified Streptomyces]MZE50471.1 alpha/beta fold hydrolase [Streptomyces sp. SID5770]